MRPLFLILAAVLPPLAAAVVLGVAGGCHEPTGRRTVLNRDPAVKIPAIKQAVDDGNFDAAGQMIKDLDSDDPAVRFYAGDGVGRLAGGDNGV
jgi:hypothetical protein